MAQHFDPVKPPNLLMNSLAKFTDEFFGESECEFSGRRKTEDGRTEQDNWFSKGVILRVVEGVSSPDKCFMNKFNIPT